MSNFYSGRVPVYAHLSLYWALKVRFPMDVGGLSRDGRVTNNLRTASLVYAVGILTPEDIETVIDTEQEGK